MHHRPVVQVTKPFPNQWRQWPLIEVLTGYLPPSSTPRRLTGIFCRLGVLHLCYRHYPQLCSGLAPVGHSAGTLLCSLPSLVPGQVSSTQCWPSAHSRLLPSQSNYSHHFTVTCPHWGPLLIQWIYIYIYKLFLGFLALLVTLVTSSSRNALLSWLLGHGSRLGPLLSFSAYSLLPFMPDIDISQSCLHLALLSLGAIFPSQGDNSPKVAALTSLLSLRPEHFHLNVP